MFWLVKGLAVLVSVVAFNVMMYFAIQTVLVPLNAQMDTLDEITAMTEKYSR
jgi:type IV secretory pathway TrbF-like protein